MVEKLILTSPGAGSGLRGGPSRRGGHDRVRRQENREVREKGDDRLVRAKYLWRATRNVTNALAEGINSKIQ